jgi:hypothetical protein
VGTQTASDIHSQEQRERISASLLACSQLAFSSHTVQDPLPREWCHPQQDGSCCIINNYDLPPPKKKKMPTGPSRQFLIKTVFPSDSELHQVDSKNQPAYQCLASKPEQRALFLREAGLVC